MQAAAWIREHAQAIILLSGVVFFGLKAMVMVPIVLGLRFDSGRFVSFLHDWAPEYPRRWAAANCNEF
jgi:hypothetical protein